MGQWRRREFTLNPNNDAHNPSSLRSSGQRFFTGDSRLPCQSATPSPTWVQGRSLTPAAVHVGLSRVLHRAVDDFQRAVTACCSNANRSGATKCLAVRRAEGGDWIHRAILMEDWGQAEKSTAQPRRSVGPKKTCPRPCPLMKWTLGVAYRRPVTLRGQSPILVQGHSMRFPPS